MKRILTLILLCCVSFHGFAQQVVIFGDSLSDEGRLFALMQDQFPDPTYYSQGRFSNGPVWPEFVFPDRLNYAYGGALANDDNIFSPVFGSIVDNTGVFDQLNAYFAQPSNDIANTAFVFYVGPNDLFALTDFDDPDSPSSIIEIIHNIEISVDRLMAASATDITLMGLADLSLTPYVLNNASYFQQEVISLACARFNHLLQSVAADRGIDYFATDLVMHHIINNPAQYNLTNVTEACLTIVDDQVDVCDQPDHYLFWDSVHPTTRGHALLAQAFVQ